LEILAIIPARGGSKGILRKNIKMLCGKPLVAHSIEASLGSKYITRTVVSTEDEEIKQVALDFGAEVIERPQNLAQDETKTAPTMLHTANFLEAQGYKPEYTVLLQPTCPLRDANYIDNAFEYFFQNSEKGFDSCFSAFNVGNTHARWRLNFDGTAQPLYDHRLRPRRQETELHYPMICENGAFYALKHDIFLEIGDFIGKNPLPYISERIVDIDCEADFLKVEELMRKKGA
jgi:CMP-N-acetylneuraminic acid synthetase